MAESVSRMQLLQGRRGSHNERSFPRPDQLLHPAGPERIRPFIDGADATPSCPARAGQCLHSLQDSSHDSQLVHWTHGRSRWGTSNGNVSATSRDVSKIEMRPEK